MLNGVVVRGIGGRRREYRPIVSQLTSSTDPVEVASALIDAVHPAELYLADLDAIEGGPSAFEVYRAILALGVRLWVDAGIRDAANARQLADTGCDSVAGLETVPSAEAFREMVDKVGAKRLIFSLDLRDGVPLRAWPDGEQHRDAYASTLAMRAGYRHRDHALIVLDLARVVVEAGRHDDICREIASTNPHVEVIAGGGVAGRRICGG